MWSALRRSSPPLTALWRSYSSKPSPISDIRFRDKVLSAEKQRERNAPEWEKREQTLRKRFGQWNPTRKVSRQQMNDIRDLKERAPHLKTVQIADFFQMNPESIRRILKSKWVPNEKELESINKRAEKRKQLSQERKIADQAAIKSSSSPKVGLPKRPKYRARSKQNQTENKHSSRRTNKPFTIGIGDLIE